MAAEWDEFVDRAKNATFLFRRGFMDYHADRFTDHSLVVRRNGRIAALLPASEHGTSIISHGGLTYGGLLTDAKATGAEVLAILSEIARILAGEGYETLIYKPVPHIYHTLPAEEDLYALFRLNASLSERNISTTILLDNRIKFRDIRKSGIRKATKAGIEIVESSDFNDFWCILSENLMQRHGVAPVHSLHEIELLATRFPDNIRLHLATLDGATVAGTAIFLSGNVAHAQYISASPEGKELGALDLLFSHLINNVYSHQEYFDFGISNERHGTILNESLLYQKEGFGGRAICYDTYKIPLK